jgi:hypothetical protein
LSFVFANFGIAIAARMPMMTTTIRSSMSVKPFLLLIQDSPEALASWGWNARAFTYGKDAPDTAGEGTPGQSRCRKTNINPNWRRRHELRVCYMSVPTQFSSLYAILSHFAT